MRGGGKHITRPIGTSPTAVKKPYRINNMTMNIHGTDTICSTIRDIYLKTDDPEIKFWCRIAMRMSKEMWKYLLRYERMLEGHGVYIEGEEGKWQGHDL